VEVLKKRLNQDDVPASALVDLEEHLDGTPSGKAASAIPLPFQYRRIQSAFVLIHLMRISAYSRNRHSWAWNHFGRRPFASGIHLAEGSRVGLDLAIGEGS